MLQEMSVRRYGDELKLSVSVDGLVLSYRRQLQKSVKTADWLITAFPEAFVRSAESAQRGFKGYDDSFAYPAASGTFRARQDTREYVEFHLSINGSNFSMPLRITEVKKLIRIVMEFFNAAFCKVCEHPYTHVEGCPMSGGSQVEFDRGYAYGFDGDVLLPHELAHYSASFRLGYHLGRAEINRQVEAAVERQFDE